MLRRLKDRKNVCKVREVCERIFLYNFLVKDRLAGLRRAERRCQPKLGSDFQIRRTNVLQERISRLLERRKPILAKG